MLIKLILPPIKCYNYHIYLFLAPGTYSPEKVNLDKGPQYSLSGKGSAEKPLDTPGIYKNYKNCQNKLYAGVIVHCDFQRLERILRKK